MKRRYYKRFSLKLSSINKIAKRYFIAIKRWYSANRKLFWEIFLSTALITYFTYRQTNISEQQLQISLQQQKIIEYQHVIDVYEHTPKFNFSIYCDKEDSTTRCLTETIAIENRGCPIKDFSTEVYSFIKVKTDSIEKIFPIELYFSVGRMSYEEKGVLAAYTNTYNLKRLGEVQDETFKHVETYGWLIERFHLVEVNYRDYADKEHTVFLCNREDKLDLKISKEEAQQLLGIYADSKRFTTYAFTFDSLVTAMFKK